MTETLTRLDSPGDAELISAVRGGDLSAYGDLFARHVEAARRLARQLVSPADADDLVSDAFGKVLRVLQGGGGPDVAFRAYLLTAVRRLHVDRIRAGARLHTTDDLAPFDPGVPFRDTAVEGFENEAAARAFASLPERWQLVLWHTEVEGQKPADIAPMLGMSANSVSALAYRAREGLRQAFLNSHAVEIDDGDCRWTHEHLGAYIRGGASRRDAGKVEKHIDECRRCMGIYLELVEVNSNLGALLAPLLLGTAGAAYLASGTVAAKGGLLLVLLDRGKEFLAANGQAAAIGGVVAATAVVGVSIAAVTGTDDRTVAQSPAGAEPSTRSGAAPSPAEASPPDDGRAPRPRRTAPPAPAVEPEAPAVAAEGGADVVAEDQPAAADDPGAAPAVGPGPAPTGGPAPDPDPGPDKDPGPGPDKEPTDDPGKEPTDEPTEEPAPTADLTLSVTPDANPVHASFDVAVAGVPAAASATLRVTWTQPVDVALVRAPELCDSTERGLTCKVGSDTAFTIEIRHLPAGMTVDMVLTPDAPYVDPTANTFHWEDVEPGRR